MLAVLFHGHVVCTLCGMLRRFQRLKINQVLRHIQHGHGERDPCVGALADHEAAVQGERPIRMVLCQMCVHDRIFLIMQLICSEAHACRNMYTQDNLNAVL